MVNLFLFYRMDEQDNAGGTTLPLEEVIKLKNQRDLQKQSQSHFIQEVQEDVEEDKNAQQEARGKLVIIDIENSFLPKITKKIQPSSKEQFKKLIAVNTPMATYIKEQNKDMPIIFCSDALDRLDIPFYEAVSELYGGRDVIGIYQTYQVGGMGGYFFYKKGFKETTQVLPSGSFDNKSDAIEYFMQDLQKTTELEPFKKPINQCKDVVLVDNTFQHVSSEKYEYVPFTKTIQAGEKTFTFTGKLLSQPLIFESDKEKQFKMLLNQNNFEIMKAANEEQESFITDNGNEVTFVKSEEQQPYDGLTKELAEQYIADIKKYGPTYSSLGTELLKQVQVEAPKQQKDQLQVEEQEVQQQQKMLASKTQTMFGKNQQNQPQENKLLESKVETLFNLGQLSEVSQQQQTKLIQSVVFEENPFKNAIKAFKERENNLDYKKVLALFEDILKKYPVEKYEEETVDQGLQSLEAFQKYSLIDNEDSLEKIFSQKVIDAMNKIGGENFYEDSIEEIEKLKKMKKNKILAQIAAEIMIKEGTLDLNREEPPLGDISDGAIKEAILAYQKEVENYSFEDKFRKANDCFSQIIKAAASTLIQDEKDHFPDLFSDLASFEEFKKDKTLEKIYDYIVKKINAIGGGNFYQDSIKEIENLKIKAAEALKRKEVDQKAEAEKTIASLQKEGAKVQVQSKNIGKVFERLFSSLNAQGVPNDHNTLNIVIAMHNCKTPDEKKNFMNGLTHLLYSLPKEARDVQFVNLARVIDKIKKPSEAVDPSKAVDFYEINLLDFFSKKELISKQITNVSQFLIYLESLFASRFEETAATVIQNFYRKRKDKLKNQPLQQQKEIKNQENEQLDKSEGKVTEKSKSLVQDDLGELGIGQDQSFVYSKSEKENVKKVFNGNGDRYNQGDNNMPQNEDGELDLQELENSSMQDQQDQQDNKRRDSQRQFHSTGVIQEEQKSQPQLQVPQGYEKYLAVKDNKLVLTKPTYKSFFEMEEDNEALKLDNNGQPSLKEGYELLTRKDKVGGEVRLKENYSLTWRSNGIIPEKIKQQPNPYANSQYQRQDSQNINLTDSHISNKVHPQQTTLNQYNKKKGTQVKSSGGLCSYFCCGRGRRDDVQEPQKVR